MLSADAFRLPEELDYRRKIQTHPALRRLRRLFPSYWLPSRFDSDLLDSLWRSAHALSRDSHPSLYRTVDDALTLFGVGAEIQFFALPDSQEAREGVSITEEDGILIIQLWDELLYTMPEDELRGAIGHEIGHFLLGHRDGSDWDIVLGMLEGDGRETDRLWQDESTVELFRLVMVLSQLQQLSADRIGLLVSRNLEATVIGEAKLEAGFAGGHYDIDEWLHQAETVTDDVDWVMRTHPAGPNRCLALKLFAESDLYCRAVGLDGGKPITVFQRKVPALVPLFDRFDYRRHRRCSVTDQIDEYLLELVLMDTIAVADPRRTATAVRLIDRYIPARWYGKIMDRYGDLSDDELANAELVRHWLGLATQKDSHWKSKMIRRFLRIVRVGRWVGLPDLLEVASLAAAMGAQMECRSIFRRDCGFDPYGMAPTASLPETLSAM